ncbi:MAG: helix-turn-helix transcriptional regulator [Clostridia bacterium]|nr:helix-turn-helix transcriptional regulator [Clostridia bacterium]
MIFEKEDLSFHILDVIESSSVNRRVELYNTGRNFDALSIHFDSDTWIQTSSAEYLFKKNYVTYVPARLDYRRITTVSRGIVIHFETPSYTSQSIEYFEAQNSERLIELFKSIAEHWNKKADGYTYRCAAIFNEILEECYLQNKKSSVSNSKIKPSVDYLNENFRNPNLNMSEVAAKSFMSCAYFRKIFKEEYGISPQKHLIKLRLQNAAVMISTSAYSLKEIAHMSGYNDYKYFTTEFKNHMGISPSKYSYNFYELYGIKRK